MTRPYRLRRPRGLLGFSLLEVLIAIVVFSTGILGIAALQVSGMRVTQGAQHLSVGTLVADDMIERMRANLEGVRAGDYDNQCVCHGACADTALAAVCASVSNTCSADPSTITRTCYGSECSTTAAIKTADMAEWLLQVCESTPVGTLAGVFCSGICDDAASRTIRVSWEDVETSETTPSSSHDLSLSFQPIKTKY